MGEYEKTGASHQCVKWFWETVRDDLTDDLKAKLLQYATGTSGVPATGFAMLQGNDGNVRKFAINSILKSQSIFPKAHTCFNRIDLPLYDNKEELLKFLTGALQMAVVGFDTD